MAKNQKKSPKTAKTASGKQSKSAKTKRAGAGKPRTAAKSKKSTSAAGKGGQMTKKSGHKGGQSDYNLHMKKAVSQIKTDNPTLSHQEAFKEAAHQWSTSPDNPKNK